MDAPFTVIDKVLKAAANGKEADFLRYVAENANIEFNGTTFSGKDFGKGVVLIISTTPFVIITEKKR